MSNRTINLGARLQGSDPFLEIQSVNSDNFTFDANSQLNLTNSLTVQDITINGDFNNAGGGAVSSGTLTASTSLTTPKIIFTDNNSTGLTIESSDGADFLTMDSTNGSEHIDFLKDVNTGGNKITMGTNSSRGIIQYGDIRNSTIDNTNTCSLNTTGTSGSWASSRTITFRNSANGDATIGSVAIQGNSDVNADIDILDQSNSNAHKFIFANTNTGHSDTNLQQRIDFINAQDSNITRSDNLVGRISSVNDNMSFIIPDKSHSSNSSLLQLTKNNPDDIPTINSFIHFDTKSDANRVMNIENNDTTYDSSEAQRTRATAIHLGNNGHYSDSVVGNTIAKIQASWRDDGQGQLKLLARQTSSSSAHESGLLISDNTGGGTALDVPLSASEMVIKGIKIDGIKDIDYFNGLKVGHGGMLGNGLQLLASDGSVISGSPSAYGSSIHPKLKTDGGLAVDSDGIYATASPEWVGSGSSPEKILAENKRVVANAGDNTTFDFNYGGTERNGCNSYHVLGTSKSDATNAVNAGLQIFSNNESDGGDGATSSLMLRTRTENDGDTAVKTDVSVMLTNNNGEIALASSHFSSDDNNTTGGVFGGTGLTNRSSAIHHDRMLFGKNGGIILSPQAKTADDNSIDDVYAQFRDNYALQGAGLGELSIYNGNVDAGINLLAGVSNMTGGTDLGGTPISVPNGFNISYSTAGVATLNNKKTKEIVFKVASGEKMRVNSDGKIGISKTNPSGLLEIGGQLAVSATDFGNYLNVFGVQTSGFGYPTSTSINVACYCQGGCLAYAFHTRSDERTKSDIEDISNGEALNIIRQIQSKKYHYNDPAKRSDNKTIGFIAQQVQGIYPDAVQSNIGDLYENIPVNCDESGNVVLNIEGDENTGHFTFWVKDGTEYRKIESTQVDGVCSLGQYYEEVYLFEREINNFLTVDKDKIFGLYHSAIQELDTDVRELETSNDSHNNNITELQNRVGVLETENNGLLELTGTQEQQIQDLTTRIASLETLLNSLTNRVVINETTLQGLIINN